MRIENAETGGSPFHPVHLPRHLSQVAPGYPGIRMILSEEGLLPPKHFAVLYGCLGQSPPVLPEPSPGAAAHQGVSMFIAQYSLMERVDRLVPPSASSRRPCR